MDVGSTPLIKIGPIYAKLECTNPGGSIKDRMVKYVLEQSIERGYLLPGMHIIEATSGNTGISLSYFAGELGYNVTIVMPENMSQERKNIIQRFGANLILCEAGNFEKAAQIRDDIVKSDPKIYFTTNQFENPLNVMCHYHTTGQEILSQMEHNIDAFVAGVGTGGTLVGTAKAIREAYPDAKIFAVEPLESSVMSGGCPGYHNIAGIGDGFIPGLVSNGQGLIDLINGVVTVSSADAFEAAKSLEKDYGRCVGTSSGANFLASMQVLEKLGGDTSVVTVLPDGFHKYETQGLKGCASDGCKYQSTCSQLIR